MPLLHNNAVHFNLNIRLWCWQRHSTSTNHNTQCD